MKNDLNLMPTSPTACLALLDHLNIAYENHEHEAVFTVAESEKVDKQIDAHHTRNMYLRTKKKQNFLITLSHDSPVDIKKLADALDVKNFSFGSSDRLMDLLGVFPGSVTPLSSMNASPDDVTIILEEKMMAATHVAFHPLINTMTVVITPNDLLKFLDHFGHKPIIVNMESLAP